MCGNGLMTLYKKPFENIAGKEENAGNQKKMLVTSIFSFFYNVFYPSQGKYPFLIYILMSYANAFNLDRTKILTFGKELKSKTKQVGSSKKNIPERNALLECCLMHFRDALYQARHHL